MDRIQFRRDSSENWKKHNPTLMEGEVGYEIDTRKRKIGDGYTAWNDLKYLAAENISQELGDDDNLVLSQSAITELITEGYLYKGIADTTTHITEPAGKIFYIVTTPGNYIGFGNITINGGLNIVKWDGTTWIKDEVQLDVTKEQVDEIEELLNNTISNVGIDEYETFSTSKAYAVGDVVSHNNKLYKFIVPHSAGAFDEGQVEETSLKSLLEKEDLHLQGQTNFSISKTCFKTHISYSYGTNNTVHIPFFIKADETITLKLYNKQIEYNSEGRTDFVVTFRTEENESNGPILYDEGENTATLTKDVSELIVYANNGIKSLSFDLEVYSTDIISLLKKNSNKIQINSNDIDSIKNILNSTLRTEDKNINMEGAVDDFIYSQSAYVGLNYKFSKDCVIKSFSIRSFGFDSSVIGREMEFVIGTIDQRNWLLPRITFSAKISNVDVNHYILTFEFNDFILAKQDEVIFIKMVNLATSSNNVLAALSSASFMADKKVLKTNNLNDALQEVPNKGFAYYNINYINIDTIFAFKEDIEQLLSSDSNLQQQINNSKIYTDDVNGNKYYIKISNGKIILQSLKINNLLVIGHSFVTYNNAPDADWYLDDGENRAMAPSVNEHQWTEFIKNKIGCSIEKKSGVDFERNYSTEYDFSTKWNITDDYDAICVYLCENAVYSDTLQKSWEAMLNYLKSAAPKARIYCTASWFADARQEAIEKACSNVSNVVYVNCLGINIKDVNKSNRWEKGDYYIGRSNQYYPMGAAYSHPNDMGHMLIANRFLQAFGDEQIQGINHTITLEQVNGGEISTVNTDWIENAVVTIRCIPEDGHEIQSITVQKVSGDTIEATKRTNDYYDSTERVYYTFVMPNEDVLVTPIWS